MHLDFAPMEEFLWNPRQWQGSRKVQRMSWAERGLYRELMDECYLHGAIPGDVEALADMLGESVEVLSSMWPRVSKCFVTDPDDPSLLLSVFVEIVREKQNAVRKSRSIIGKIGAGKRWQKGGAVHPVDGDCYFPDGDCMAEASQPMASDGGERGREGVVTTAGPSLRSGPPSVTVASDEVSMRKRARARKLRSADIPFSLEITPPILEASNAILDICPKTQPLGKRVGDNIRRDPGQLAKRLEGIIGQNLKGVDLGLLVAAWRSYISSTPETIKAPQYFFGDEEAQGPNGAHWHSWARLVFKKRKDALPPAAPIQILLPAPTHQPA